MKKRDIIFYDTEFTHLDITKGQLLSIGLIKENGEELYLELEYNDECVHPWVTKNVLPYLENNPIKIEDARMKLWKFVGNHDEKEKPYLMAYVNQFDSIYWYRLFADPKEHPVFWIPLDFASILFAYGYKPDAMGDDHFFEKLHLDKGKYKLHNALDDARMLKDVYYKLMEKRNEEAE